MPIDKLSSALARAREWASPTRNAGAAEVKGGEPVVTTEEPATLQAIQRVAAQLDSYMKSVNRSLEFKMDEDSGRTVVSVRDSETGELIRQIPSEEVLRMARYMDTSSILVSITA